MTDVVYVLGSGSFWGDNELRFSLRSLQDFVSDMGTVYVVGAKPKWLGDVVHLPYPDKHVCKERNIMEKMAYCCGHPDLSDDFLHVHDDHFALAPTRASDIPSWAGGSLESMAARVKAGNHWGQAVANTDKALKAQGLTTHNFDLHYPMLFNKNLFPEIMDRYDWRGTERGFVVKSLYANTVPIVPVINSDLKINQRYELRELVNRLKGRPWFSLGNAGLNGHMKKLLGALYPNRSRFEII